jgi:alpha-tubulin suppressor-like RCC1 family protein
VLSAALSPLRGATSIALGEYHSCALVEGGKVSCWGGDVDGALGDGPSDSALYAGEVVLVGGAPLTGARHVALGSTHGCALVENGEVRCWGSNFLLQLGDGTTTERPSAVPVVLASGAPLSGALALAVGAHHGCVVTAAGEVDCWGHNTSGQLGDGSTTGRANPVPVEVSPGVRLANVAALALGDFHTCALSAAGEVDCWGDNDYGQLGDGSTTSRTNPVPVVLLTGERLTDVQAVAAGGRHSCALMADGGLYCWGYNDYNQLGDGTSTSRPYARQVKRSPGLPVVGALAVDLGFDHTCMLQAENRISCWGANEDGQCGLEEFTPTTYPVPVPFP